MEQPTAGNQDTFIERVRLQGYKSIEDVEVTFKPGLNILIGANGSGKTNFVRCLDIVLKRNFKQTSNNFQAKVDYRSDSKLIKSSFFFDEQHSKKFPTAPPVIEEIFLPHESLTLRSGNTEYIKWLNENYRVFDSLFVAYGLPKEFNNISTIEKTQIFGGTLDSNVYLEVQPSLSEGLHQLLYRLFLSIIDSVDDKKPKLSFPAEFLDNLSFYSPVKDIRLEENYRVEPIKNGKEILHVRFEFFVDGKWRPWTHLSDGTKRLVYIITEVTFANNIVLLEEPELGIHPHQLSKLMDFLEAAAEHKQIILTTHSPQVLNSLRTDELDRIIVVRYEKDKGTQMSHLTEEEQRQARAYMEAGGLDLSEYWVHSSLEKETESV